MGYYIDGKSIEINPKCMRLIGQGKKGNVYKYDKTTAIKVFKENIDTPIDRETADYLSNISTDRIILPKSLLFYNNVFKGYTYKLVPKIGSGKRIIMLSKTELFNDVRILENDIEKLSQQKVILSGIDRDNIIFNGELYIADPTGYRIVCDCDDVEEKEVLERTNKLKLHLLLIDLITKELEAGRFSNDVVNCIKTMLNMKDASIDSSKFLIDMIYEDDSIKEFAKRLQ